MYILHLALKSKLCYTLSAVIQCKKDEVFPYSFLSVGPGADPGIEAVSPQATLSHPPGGRLPLLSAGLSSLYAGTKLYFLVTDAHACGELAQSCHLEADQQRFEPATF